MKGALDDLMDDDGTDFYLPESQSLPLSSIGQGQLYRQVGINFKKSAKSLMRDKMKSLDISEFSIYDYEKMLTSVLEEVIRELTPSVQSWIYLFCKRLMFLRPDLMIRPDVAERMLELINNLEFKEDGSLYESVVDDVYVNITKGYGLRPKLVRKLQELPKPVTDIQTLGAECVERTWLGKKIWPLAISY